MAERKLVLGGQKPAEAIYVQLVTDDDGDLELQVANNPEFQDYTRVGFFTICGGKLSLSRFSLSAGNDLVNLDEKQELCVD